MMTNKMMLIQRMIRMIKTMKRMMDRSNPILTLVMLKNQPLKDLARPNSRKMLSKLTKNHLLQFSSHHNNLK